MDTNVKNVGIPGVPGSRSACLRAGPRPVTIDPRLLGSLRWRCVGPHRGGRVVAVAGHPAEPATFYFGACAGGVWKTTDGGTYWENVSDGFFETVGRRRPRRRPVRPRT